MSTKILLAIGQKVYLEGLKYILRGNIEFQVVGTASDSAEMGFRVETLVPDVLIVDETLLGEKPFEVLAKIRSTFGNIQFILILAGIEPGFIYGCVVFGITGVILSTEEPELILSAIRSVADGDVWMSHPIFAAYISDLLVRISDHNVDITYRENEVLSYLLQDKTNKDIASEMGITERTVEYHIKNLLEKLKVRSRVGISLWARNRMIAKR
jgi:DNA-binding NarL/FixJ family response regulator